MAANFAKPELLHRHRLAINSMAQPFPRFIVKGATLIGEPINRRHLLTTLAGGTVVLLSGAQNAAPERVFHFAAPGDAAIVTSAGLIDIDPGLPTVGELTRRLDDALRQRKVLDHIAMTQSRVFALGSVTLDGPRDLTLDFQTTLEFPPIGCDPVSCCYGLFPGPPELGAVNPYTVHDHGQPACQSTDWLEKIQTLGRRFSAASTVWAISVTMVIGPTPPGTGVYAAHFSMTADSSTSPIPPEW